MLVEVILDLLPKRIDDKLHSLTPSKFCGRNEIAIARYQDNGISLLLERHAGYVQPDPHIHAFLSEARLNTVLRKPAPSIQKVLQLPLLAVIKLRRLALM